MPVVFCPWQRILWWDSDRTCFFVEILPKEGVHVSVTLCFKTRQGTLIDDLIHDWAAEMEQQALDKEIASIASGSTRLASPSGKVHTKEERRKSLEAGHVARANEISRKLSIAETAGVTPTVALSGSSNAIDDRNSHLMTASSLAASSATISTPSGLSTAAPITSAVSKTAAAAAQPEDTDSSSDHTPSNGGSDTSSDEETPIPPTV